jgi:hypothetical protein
MTTSKEELPEYQIFSILRRGEKEPIGPFSQNQIVDLLNDGEIQAEDLVYYDDIGEWRPLRDVFELHQAIANHTDDGQDQEIVSDVFGALSEMLTDQEPLFYIAVQERPAIAFRKPDAIALSQAALYVVHQRRGSLEVEPYPWDKIYNLVGRIGDQDAAGTMVILMQNASRVEIERIPRKQLRRAEEIASDLLPHHDPE